MYSADVQHLKFGDLIFLNYTQKVFEDDIEAERIREDEDFYEGNTIDEEQQQILDDEERKRNRKLKKLIDKPRYVYKGVVFSDGILDKDVFLVPEQSFSNTQNAKCQFKKCLFRIDIFDKCKYHVLYRQQIAKVEEVRGKRDQIEMTNDFKELEKINSIVKKEETYLAELLEARERESNSNDEV